MIELEYIQGKNIVTYQEFFLNLNKKKGLTLVRGDNRAGKSLLFSSVANVLYFSPPLEKKKDQAKKLHEKGSELRLGFVRNNNFYHILQYMRGNSVSYSIYKHDKTEEFDKENHNLNIRHNVKNEISQLFPQPQELFYSITYVNSYRHHSLQKGSNEERHRFFKEVFNLEILEKIREKLWKELKDKKNVKTEISVLENELNKYETITKNYLDEKKNLLNHYKSLTKKKDKKYSKDLQKLQEINAYIAHVENLSYDLNKNLNLDRDEKNLEKLKNLYKEYTSLFERKKYQEKLKNKFNRLQEEKKRLEPYSKIDEKKQKKKYKKLKKVLIDLEEKIRETKENKIKIKELKNLEKELKNLEKNNKLKNIKNRIKEKNIQSLIEELENDKNNEKKRLKEIRGANNSCPTCKRILNEKLKKDLENQIKKNLKSIKEKIDYLNKSLKKQELENLPCYNIKQLLEEKRLKEKEREKLIKNIKGKQKYKKIVESIKDLPDIENIEDKRNITREKIKRIEEKIDLLSNRVKNKKGDLKQREKLKEFDLNLSVISARNKQKSLNKRLKRTGSRQKELNNNIQKLKTTIETKRKEKEQKDTIEKQISDKRKVTRDIHIYEALVDAYSAKGLRTIQIQHLSKQLENNMNKYATLLFPEPIRFEFCIDKNNFNIIAERNGRKSDVSLLSGSESQCFKLLCIISLIPIIPEHLRTNVCILDEIEGGMDDKSKKLFSYEFLPKLKEIVPNVILITPMNQRELFVQSDREIYIKKRNKKSGIIEN